jgi:hypothetical protein
VQATRKESAAVPPDDTSDEAIQYLTLSQLTALVLRTPAWTAPAGLRTAADPELRQHGGEHRRRARP